MRSPSAGHRRELRVNMTPMIDVVFLLIIFFLVSSHLARQENRLPLPLPAADGGEEVSDTSGNRVVVNVLHDGSMLLAGRKVTSKELLRRLGNEVAETSSDLEVRIRSDRGVAFQFVQPILLAVSKSGARNVTFAVTKRSPRGQ